jgi:hypothetical protein
VNWGPPAITKVLALGISECDWRRMTDGGTNYYGPVGGLLSGLGLYSMLGLRAPTPGVDKSIVAAGSLSVLGLPIPNCSLLEPTVPRGYAWLNNPDGSAPDSNCMITVKVGDKPRSFLLTAGLVTALCLPRLTALQGNRCWCRSTTRSSRASSPSARPTASPASRRSWSPATAA